MTLDGGDTLDQFRRCSAPGCEWQILAPGPAKCWEHFGQNRWPQFLRGDDGEILDSKFMPGSAPPEPWD